MSQYVVGSDVPEETHETPASSSEESAAEHAIPSDSDTNSSEENEEDKPED
jgi:hypothetical protein